MSLFEQKKGNKKENPSRLLIGAHKGYGKTTIMEGLPNAVLIDLEDRSSHISGTIANLKRAEVMNPDIPPHVLFKKAISDLREMKRKGTVIDFLILETLSSFERIVRKQATENFVTSTLVGQKMADKKNIIDVTAELPNGAGWMFFFIAYQQLMGALEGVADKAIIYTAHIKQRSIVKDGEEVLGEDIDFPGKAGIDLMKNCQACGILKMDKEDPYKRILDFSHEGKHMITKASSSHLHNKKILISEMKDGKLITHWDQIFPGWIK